MTREIALTNGGYAVVDDEDHERLAAHSWRRSSECYAVRAERCGSRSQRIIGMHQVVLPVGPGLVPDHIDRDGLNNRRSNLRPATRAQNKANSPGHRNRGCRYKGVSLRPGKGRTSYRASISVNGKSRFIGGSFQTEEAAAKAYDKAALEVFGEFALVNFPFVQEEKSSARW